MYDSIPDKGAGVVSADVGESCDLARAESKSLLNYAERKQVRRSQLAFTSNSNYNSGKGSDRSLLSCKRVFPVFVSPRKPEASLRYIRRKAVGSYVYGYEVLFYSVCHGLCPWVLRVVVFPDDLGKRPSVHLLPANQVSIGTNTILCNL